MKTLHYCIVESASRIPWTFLKVEKTVYKSICFVLLSFFCIVHNIETIGRIPMWNICNKCCTLRDHPFLVTTLCELWLVSCSPQNASWSLFDTLFFAYIKYNSKNMRSLQVYYKLNDSSSIKNALVYVKSCKTVAMYNLQPIQTSLSVIWCVCTNDNKTQGS